MVEEARIEGFNVVRRRRAIVNLRELCAPELVLWRYRLSPFENNVQEQTYEGLVNYRIKQRTGILHDGDTAEVRSAPELGVPQDEG